MPDFGNRKVRIADCRAVRASDKAILVDVPTVGEVWIPQSQIDDDSEVYRTDDEGDLVISNWIAKEKGLS